MIVLDYQRLLDKLKVLNQTHLLQYWDQLRPSEKEILSRQIESIDIEVFRIQQEILNETPIHRKSIAPFTDFLAADEVDPQTGKKLISEGKMGCIILAGGQGSRLKFNGPKGMFPITPIKHKSLFQVFAEKALAASKQAGVDLPLAIMTSPLNHGETTQFFKKKSYFGLKEEQITFFVQGMLPFLDPSGNLFLESPFSIAHGPDGNGSLFHNFFQQGVGEAWYQRGVRYLNVILIDNPLSDPYDATMGAYLANTGSDIVAKCTSKIDPEEKVGLIAKEGDHLIIKEYTEVSEKERHARAPDGTLLYSCANTSLFCFKMEFVKKIVNLPLSSLQIHRSLKSAKHLNLATEQSQDSMAWKFERFIFDVFPLTQKIKALVYPRKSCFAPLKNSSGTDSVSMVQELLSNRDREVFSTITGIPCLGKTPFEIAQQFYYPTPQLFAHWRNKQGPYENYIEE